MSNKPITKLKDGLITATIWKNQTKDGKDIYSVTLSRAYLKDDQLFESTSFSGAELLKAARLIERAYSQIKQLRKSAKAQQVPA